MKYTAKYCKNNRVAIKVISEEELQKVYTYFPNYKYYQSWSNMISEKTDCVTFTHKPLVNHCRSNWYEDNGYTVITAEKFLADNFVLPEKWAFKGSEESKDDNKDTPQWKWFNEKSGRNYGFFPSCYYYSDGSHSWNILKEGFTELTFDQFKEHVLNQNSMRKRFKTKEEFEQEFGEDWRKKLYFSWNSAGKMDYLFGQYEDKVNTSDWSISEDMLTTNPLPAQETCSMSSTQTTETPKTNFGIRVENQNGKEIVEWFKSNGFDIADYYGYYVNDEAIYYVTDTKKVNCRSENIPDITIYSLTDLKMNTKEIIGYKFKEGCEQYEEAANTIAEEGAGYLSKGGLCDKWLKKENWGKYKENLEKAGVLDLWFELVYKDDWQPKVGEWVVTIVDISYCKKNDVLKIESYNHDGIGIWVTLSKDGTSHYDGFRIAEYKGYILEKTIRKATKEEVQAHLIAEAKKRGFKNGIEYNNVVGGSIQTVGNFDGLRYWVYDGPEWLTDGHGGAIYKDGIWAEIVKSEHTVSVGGKFDVTIKDGKIYHGPSNITDFVKELVEAFTDRYDQFGGYQATIKDVTFSKTGCQSVNTTLADWKAVLDKWKELQGN